MSSSPTLKELNSAEKNKSRRVSKKNCRRGQNQRGHGWSPECIYRFKIPGIQNKLIRSNHSKEEALPKFIDFSLNDKLEKPRTRAKTVAKLYGCS